MQRVSPRKPGLNPFDTWLITFRVRVLIISTLCLGFSVFMYFSSYLIHFPHPPFAFTTIIPIISLSKHRRYECPLLASESFKGIIANTQVVYLSKTLEWKCKYLACLYVKELWIKMSCLCFSVLVFFLKLHNTAEIKCDMVSIRVFLFIWTSNTQVYNYGNKCWCNVSSFSERNQEERRAQTEG